MRDNAKWYSVQFYNTQTGNWFAAHHDFDCLAEYSSEEDATKWIESQNRWEMMEGEEQTQFRVVEG